MANDKNDATLKLCEFFFDIIVLDLELDVDIFFSAKAHKPQWVEDMVRKIHTQVLGDDLEQLYEFKNQKNEAQASRHKELGNKLTQISHFTSALEAYTGSISQAPHDSASTTLALSFANRGAVLKSMARMKESIIDTQRALDHGYPDHLKYKLYSRLGQCCLHLGKIDEAKTYLSQALEAVSKSKQPQCVQSELKQKIELELKKCDASLTNLVTVEEEKSYPPVHGLPKVSPAPPPHLSQGCSNESDCLSKNVTIKYDATRGRHLVAAVDIKPGDVLLVEPTNSAVLQEKFQWTHCSHCFQRCRTLLPCPTCSWCMFCSDECVSAAHNYHAVECDLVPLLEGCNQHRFIPMRIVLRAVASHTEEQLCAIADEVKLTRPTTDEEHRTLGFDKNGKFPSGIAGILSNQFNKKIWPPSETAMACAFAVLTTEFMDVQSLENKVKIGALVVRLYYSLLNMFNICETKIKGFAHRYRAIGNYMPPTMCLFKHSCDPNVWQHNHKTTTVTRAIQVIPKGSVLYMTYGRPFLRYTKPVRVSDLKLMGVTCTCAACEFDYPLFENLPEAPCFDLTSEMRESEKISAGAKQIMDKAFADNNYVVNKETLSLFLKQIVIMDKCGKKINKRYYEMVEQVRGYFGRQANVHIHDPYN